MLQHYNRASAHKRVQQFYQETTGKELNLNTELTKTAEKISHMLDLVSNKRGGHSSCSRRKVSRLVRLTDNDEQWQAHLDKVAADESARESDSDDEEEDVMHASGGDDSMDVDCNDAEDSEEEDNEEDSLQQSMADTADLAPPTTVLVTIHRSVDDDDNSMEI